MKKKAYISYSRRSDYSFIKALLAASDSATELRSLVVGDKLTRIEILSGSPLANIDLDQWDLLFDEKALEQGGSINAFMEELSEAEKIIVLLSRGYFQSPFCLTELLHIYYKRAHELLPIIVFVDGFSPGEIKVSELQQYWAEQPGNVAAKRLYARFVDELPLVLAWLLGIYDEALASWDELFHLFNKAECDVAPKVIAALSREYQPRFQYLSSKQREQLIASNIEKIFANQDLKIYFDSLKKRNAPVTYIEKPFAESLAIPCSVKTLKSRLNTLIDWLENIAKENDPSTRLLRLAGQVKSLLGWLLIAAVDDRKLHILIHTLNRQQATAKLSMHGENETSFQMIVAAVAHTSVRFFYNPGREKRALIGEGELVLTEKGADPNTYSESFKREDGWFNQYKTLFDQMSKSLYPEQTTPAKHNSASLSGAIEAILERRKDFFLLFDRNLPAISQVTAFRKDLGAIYPNIQQVDSEDESKKGAQQFYLEGLNSGYLDQKIRHIYSLIHRITHEAKDNS